jgi:hypothetical protein
LLTVSTREGKRMMKLSIFVAAGLLAAGTALAQAPQGGGNGGGRMAACRDDAQKLCAGKTGPDRRACMEENKDKLSDACKAARAAVGR